MLANDLNDLIADERIARQFENFVRDPAFPCVGAKSALARGRLETLVCRSLASGWDDLRIHETLLSWSWDYVAAKRAAAAGGAKAVEFRSLAVIFRDDGPITEAGFERKMWTRLQSLADKDVWRGQTYDPAVSADPDDPHFSLSFGGQAFFVVGLHPGASRPARRFAFPTLVFNLHDQFATLRQIGRYEGLREAIIARDVTLAGEPNPMLGRHGQSSEARQYSGRAVSGDWQCPFRDRRADAGD